jgi:hypothetical protein
MLRAERDRLLPERILQVKRHRQGYLFKRIFPITHSKLVEAYEHACLAGFEQLPGTMKQQRASIQSLYTLGLRMLCLQVLNHRGLLQPTVGQLTGQDLRLASYAAAWEQVPKLPDALAGIRQYLLEAPSHGLPDSVAQALFDSLNGHGEYDFAGITPEMLGPFWQRALLKHPRTLHHDRERQKESGIFYTSKRITQTILDRLPIEELAPCQRHVLDFTCGSGSFMMAARQRLLELARPRSLSHVEKVSLAQSFLHGNDRDHFAVEVAKLGLVLGEPGTRLNCQFRTDDVDVEAIRKGRPNFPVPSAHAPSVIVGNPPFKQFENTEERAALFLHICVEHWLTPGGLLGLVLPATFLSGAGRCQSTREFLLAKCELLELWDLPRQILADPAFTENGTNGNVSGDIETCIVLLRKRERGSSCRVYTVGRAEQSKEEFRNNGVPSTHGVNDILAQAPLFGKGRWPVTPIADILQRLSLSRECCPLAKIARVANGIKRTPETPCGRGCGPDLVPWLQSSQGEPVFRCIEAGSCSGEQFIHYPGRMTWPRSRWAKMDSASGALLPGETWRRKGIFACKKILIRANMDPAGEAFCHGFIDSGHYPSNSFHFVWIDPRLPDAQGWNYEALLAIINGPVSDAWMGVARTINNPTDLLERLPVPRLTTQDRTRLAHSASEVIGMPDGPARDQKLDALRKLVVCMYPLSAAERDRLEKARSSCPAPDWHASWVDESWPIHCIVESVEGPSEKSPPRIAIRVPGFRKASQPYFGPIPPEMPGWAIRVGAEFQAEIPFSDATANTFDPTRVRRFRPLPFAYERQGNPQAAGKR